MGHPPPAAFERLKEAITEESQIAFYDTRQPVTLEVDASMKGLGAALVQDKEPVAYASKSLTKTQANYSNIECAMLPLVHVER